ncbi:penicillin-binding protein 1C [Legionella sp. 16cNR16C]|uniref:penicillin-binding protein 1C n=1 Tax=Legionella sp. 16cNR16C TaxID=2905656 RepID=UPI001E3C37C5|nr:penicillin-binding protein 1C [Legionella sp. 16cNR16C]MCE3045250.1 penicillin-binding protein 1C [Legionella sp. 16cNR16C]
MKYRLSIIFLVICAAVSLGYYCLPKPPLLQGLPFSTAVWDCNGRLLRLSLSRDEKYRLYVPLSKISPQLIEATLLQEDQYFYKHPGLNPVSMLKAVWETYVVQSRRQGASTITMQLARIRFNINSKKWSGKLQQIIRAIQLERHYSKQQILEAYLNLAPYGGNIEGVGAASQIYFNESAMQLSLPQALTLSVIPQNPGKRTPHNQQLKTIRNKLFARWLQIHPQDRRYQNAMTLPLAMKTIRDLPFAAPHFVNSLLSTHRNQQEIHTTLNLKLQSLTERITRRYLLRKKGVGAFNAAVLLIDTRDMSVKTAMGSANFYDAAIGGQINGMDIKRSPGSTLKPFIYALALDQGLIHPYTVLKDVPHSFGAYNPENFDNDFMGPIRAKEALILSRNIPAIYLASQLAKPGLFGLLEQAQVSQLKSESYYGLALTLGGAEVTMKELATLYAMLANDGLWRPLRMLKEDPSVTGKRLLSREASFLILEMLKDTPHSDLLFKSRSLPIAWKTGTSSGYRDAWTVGNFGPYVLIVWIGNFNNKGNPAFVGKNIAAPLFFELVEAIQHENGPLKPIDKHPERMNLTRIPVCKASGLLPTRYCKDTEMSWFIPGKSPIKTDNIYREVAINRLTGLRTCHFDENTRFEIYEFWPSDLARIFKQAGIQRRIPPVYEADCNLSAGKSLALQISSPQSELNYIVKANSDQPSIIPLSAVTDADVRNLYWFINDNYLGKTANDQPLLWAARPGKFVVRVIDDHGYSDARDITVRVSS